MSFCRSWTPLSALTEPADGKVQCLLDSWLCQLWLVYLIPPLLLREWEGSIQTENAGFVCICVRVCMWCVRVRGVCVWVFFFFFGFYRKNKLA